MAKSIENALGKAIPVLILASLLGIGRLADKVVGVIRKIRQRIENAIVKFWNFIKGKAKGLLEKMGVGKFNANKKDKEEKKAKEKYEERNDTEKRKDLSDGLAAASAFAKKPEHGIEDIEKELPRIQDKYGMQQLKMIKR